MLITIGPGDDSVRRLPDTCYDERERMIFVYLDLLKIDPFAAVVLFGALASALVAGISFHEFSHAYVADLLGDGLPRSRGRVTLNPLAHLDPAGTILLFVVGFGWGKPVPVNPNASRNPKAALAIVAGAGPLSNFAVAARAAPASPNDPPANDYLPFQARYGFAILIALIALPFLTGGQFGILFEAMSPIINALVRLLAGAPGNVL